MSRLAAARCPECNEPLSATYGFSSRRTYPLLKRGKGFALGAEFSEEEDSENFYFVACDSCGYRADDDPGLL